MLQELTCEQVVALISACVWRERGEQRPRVREDMQGPYRSLLEAARRIGKVGAVLHAHAAQSVLEGSGRHHYHFGLSRTECTVLASQAPCRSLLEGSLPHWPAW